MIPITAGFQPTAVAGSVNAHRPLQNPFERPFISREGADAAAVEPGSQKKPFGNLS
jgi:hypothetical protein